MDEHKIAVIRDLTDNFMELFSEKCLGEEGADWVAFYQRIQVNVLRGIEEFRNEPEEELKRRADEDDTRVNGVHDVSRSTYVSVRSSETLKGFCKTVATTSYKTGIDIEDNHLLNALKLAYEHTIKASQGKKPRHV